MQIQEGDTCEALSVEFGIALRAFYYLNKVIDSQCGNLWLETSYCVGPVGDIATYSGFATSNFITLTPATYTTTTSSSPPQLAWASTTTTTQLPLASGTIEGCYEYRNTIPVPVIVEQSLSQQADDFDDYANSCMFVKTIYGISDDDLYEWNPSLKREICSFREGFSYCVMKTETSSYCKSH